MSVKSCRYIQQINISLTFPISENLRSFDLKGIQTLCRYRFQHFNAENIKFICLEIITEIVYIIDNRLLYTLLFKYAFNKVFIAIYCAITNKSSEFSKQGITTLASLSCFFQVADNRENNFLSDVLLAIHSESNAFCSSRFWHFSYYSPHLTDCSSSL